ncbi:MAG: hypothetical protein WCK96_14875 [Methylococcales bacterium]
MNDEYQVNIYPNDTPNPTVNNADAKRKSVAVCFSGGGSRALTCAWGQLLGLHELQGENGKTLLDDVRYISSVSGGTWAAVLYTFRPENITDAEFLGNIYPPSQLYYDKDKDKPNGLNVTKMAASALGKVPQNFANLFEFNPIEPDKNILFEFVHFMMIVKDIKIETSAKWLWMYVVGKNVLADFGLYSYSFSKNATTETPWNYADAKYFSLSHDYAYKNIFINGNALSDANFVYARTNCPMLIVNTNVIGKDCTKKYPLMSAPLQIPMQVSAVSAGIYGTNPCATDTIGGGDVESFGFSSSLLSSKSVPPVVPAEFSRAYTLADIAACSSAFYAAALAAPLKAIIDWLLKLGDEHLSNQFSGFVDNAEQLDLKDIRSKLSSMQEEIQNLNTTSFVPQYNYWPVGQVSQGAAANKNTEFTDGGDLENTGVAGLLAQVQGTVSNIIAFVNGDDVLFKHIEVLGIGGQIIAATQMAALFGVAYDPSALHVLKPFQNYLADGINPFTGLTDPMGFLQVFDNSGAEFDALRTGLYAANGNGDETDPAFFLQKLTVVPNTLLGITQTNSINVLWVQNARVNTWQNQITDETLKTKIEKGQGKLRLIDPLIEFAGFPYYSTFSKIHQTAAETNTLAQMWAWCVSHQDSPLSVAITKLFNSAV